MDELFRMMGPGAVGLDWFVVFTFAVVAVVYFLAPVLGYPVEKRGMILISLYLLVGYGVVVLLHVGLQYLFYLGSSNTEPSIKPAIHLGYLFGILKLVIFLASQGA